MPVMERDPWRLQYFEHVFCPPGTFVPTDDADAWELFPDYRWVYNKLEMALSLSLPSGPHGVMPTSFPVFSKPIYNMRGMGTGSRLIATAGEYVDALAPGHFWMPVLVGDHISTDVAVESGHARWWRHSAGYAVGDGMFDYWVIRAGRDEQIEMMAAPWISENLAGYTGMLNIETIGGTIIEMHLRFADQWPDLYGGDAWVRALIQLYSDGVWRFEDTIKNDAFSIPLFGDHEANYGQPPGKLIDEVLSMPSVSSLQITFDQDKPGHLHAMPPGGFRLAIVNCTDLDEGLLARETLRRDFDVMQAAGISVTES